MSLRLSTVLAAAALAACTTLGPDYRRPESPLPPRYSRAPASAAAASPAPDAWWTLFGDPALDALVGEALASNQDLAAAAARVAEARALVGLARADRFPRVDATAGASRTKLSQDSSQLPPGFDLEFDRFRAAGTLSFEVDFWGRLARASEAARAELLGSEEGRRALRLGLAAEVAGAYFDLLAFAEDLGIARGTRASRAETVRLQQERFDAGTISELDLAQAQGELEAAEAAVPALERRARQTENRLGVLLGRTGGEVARGGGLQALALPEVPVGLPSQLLERRPDVLAAEQRLVAANARIGAARAAYFPAIALTAYAGSESIELGSLLGSGTGVWQAALSIVEPILHTGRTRRAVDMARARERQAVAAYAKALQSAFAEVEDALVARSTGAAERSARERQVEALTRARRLAELRYEAGETAYFEILDAERSLFAARLALTDARRAELAAAVVLFKALGGGWASP